MHRAPELFMQPQKSTPAIPCHLSTKSGQHLWGRSASSKARGYVQYVQAYL